MKLTQIQLRDFRAFAGGLNLPLPYGCNLLLHGENRSGKSLASSACRIGANVLLASKRTWNL